MLPRRALLSVLFITLGLACLAGKDPRPWYRLPDQVTVCRSPAPPIMPIKLDSDVSRIRFAEALELARSEKPLPAAWLERTKKVGESPSKTFIAMLGTALLAKATNPKVDPFALKVRKLPTAYSARALCKEVLVPCAVEAGVHIGTTGAEPLNNQPFFRHERVAPDMAVHSHVRPHLEYLCACLDAMNRLGLSQALDALAAFLRVRIQEGPAKSAPLMVEQALAVPDLVKKASEFISSDPENGKRGQALVAAALDLVFSHVRTKRVNDPSRHLPGDVVAFEDDAMALAVEVKQRPATESEIVQFAQRCLSMEVHRGMAALLHSDQQPVDIDELREEAWRRHGVHLLVLVGTTDLLHEAFTWTHMSLQQALERLPQLMALRLEELEASAEGQAAWAALFKASS